MGQKSNTRTKDALRALITLEIPTVLEGLCQKPGAETNGHIFYSFSRRQTQKHRHTEGMGPCDHGGKEAAVRVTCLQTKGRQGPLPPPGAGRSREGFFLRALRGSTALVTL